MSPLRITPLGGIGKVTQNMFLYEYEDEIVIIDCGIGFPDVYMPGVDAIIPDITHLLRLVAEGKKIVGLIFSHGHDDHIAAAPYLLKELPEFPIFASPLTAAFAMDRMLEKGLERPIEVVDNSEFKQLGKHFAFKLISVTHSVPDTRHIILKTPEGIVYHGSDFKLDTNPIDGQKTDLEAIKQVGQEGVLCLLLDCLRSERDGWTESESTVGPELEKELLSTKGKFIVTLMSSHIHRIQQVVDLCEKHNRKVFFVGMSVEKNVKIALDLKKLKMDRFTMVDQKFINDYKDEEICIVIAGSQGQEGSSLVRAVYGEHRVIQIKKSDKVVFSANVIPGNEIPYYDSIDELAKNGIDVIYPDIREGVHRSGHAGAAEQQEILKLVNPKLIMPIGGADRHRSRFKKVVIPASGLKEEQVMMPTNGDIIGIEAGQYKIIQHIKLTPQIIDGLGIGDVGPVVLSDRITLSKSGIIVLVIPSKDDKIMMNKIQVISKGFVFMKQADEIVDLILKKTKEIIKKSENKKEGELKREIEKRLSRILYKMIKREPMIVAVILKS